MKVNLKANVGLESVGQFFHLTLIRGNGVILTKSFQMEIINSTANRTRTLYTRNGDFHQCDRGQRCLDSSKILLRSVSFAQYTKKLPTYEQRPSSPWPTPWPDYPWQRSAIDIKISDKILIVLSEFAVVKLNQYLKLVKVD